MEEDIREFEGGIRLDRAYGRLQEHTVETAFTALQRVKDVYLKTRDFAGFRLFMSHMRSCWTVRLPNRREPTAPA